MKLTLGIFFVFLWTLAVHAQENVVTGKVTDAADGVLIPGVSVAVKGTTTGTITNLDGEYQVKAKNGDVLIFSFIGMQTLQITVNGNVINAALKTDAKDLNEVVVVGYGVQKKALVTGANLNVKGDDIAKQATSSPLEALKGVSPGVSITSSTGAPGSDSKVVIRGIGTTGNSKPLYIIDGVNADNIDYLNPSDIASIDVLKDAASAAIYGSRGANGVILVSTKKGKVNTAPVVTYEGYVGVQNLAKKPQLLDAKQYMYLIDEANVNDGNAPLNWANELGDKDLANAYLSGANKGTDWVSEITKKNAIKQNHSISLTGGSENINYSLGASHFDQQGVVGGSIIGARYQRQTLRQNTEFKLFKKDKLDIIKIGTNTTYIQSENKQVAAGNIYYNDFRNALGQNPLMTVRDANGNYSKASSYAPGQSNPIANMYYNRNFVEQPNFRIQGGAYIEVQPIKDLKFKSQYGIDSYFGNNRQYTPVFTLGGTSPAHNEDNVNMSMYRGNNSTWTNTISYDLKLKDVHSLNIVLGHELYQNRSNFSLQADKSNSLFGDFDHAYLDNVPKQDITRINASGFNSAAQGGAVLSYFGRVNYDYKSRYMFSATMRADGSSKFATGNKWGYFPSVSAGWILSEEAFFENAKKLVDYTKFRASWGQVGNQAIPSFTYASNMSYDNVSYYFGGDKSSSIAGAYPANVPSPNVTWETSEQLNLGIDASMLNSRLSLNVDWYNKTTKNWLVTPAARGTFGAPPTVDNGGDVKNTGIEIALGWNDKISDFSYGIKGSMTYNKNEVTRVKSADGIFHGQSNVLAQGVSEIYRAEVGKPIGYFWGYKTAGILQNESEASAYRTKFANDAAMKTFKPGDVIFVDQNGDGLINDLDKVEIGNPNPDFIFGLQIDLGFKNFYLNTTFNGQMGGQNMRSYRSFTDGPKANFDAYALNRWHGEGTSNKYPRLTMAANESTRYMSDLYVENSDMLRLSNLTFGYDLKDIVKKTGVIHGAKIYIQAQNILTLTSYKGLNPEVGYGPENNGWASGIDLGLYPAITTVMGGVSITF